MLSYGDETMVEIDFEAERRGPELNLTAKPLMLYSLSRFLKKGQTYPHEKT